MIWSGTNTVGNNWGRSPVELFPLEVTCQLEWASDSLIITPLDERGAQIPSQAFFVQGNGGIFNFNLDLGEDATCWYSLEGRGMIQNIDQNLASYQLLLFPNPAQDALHLQYELEKTNKADYRDLRVLKRIRLMLGR